jgi:hypothetical protein
MREAMQRYWVQLVLRGLSIPYWYWRWQRFRNRPKVGYKCQVHGFGPVVAVVEIHYRDAPDVSLSDGRREDWYNCCERVREPMMNFVDWYMKAMDMRDAASLRKRAGKVTRRLKQSILLMSDEDLQSVWMALSGVEIDVNNLRIEVTKLQESRAKANVPE